MRRTERTFGIILIAIAIVFASCKKDITTSDLTLDLSKKATVRAYLFAELDFTTQGLESVPNGTKVILAISNDEFNENASGFWMDTVAVKDGLIEAEVPATDKGVTVTFIPAEFIYDQKQPAFSQSETIKKIYSVISPDKKIGPAPTSLFVQTGEIRTLQITYNSIESFDNFTEKVNVIIKLAADTDVRISNDGIVKGTKVILFNNSWSTVVEVGDNNRIQVDVPKNGVITMVFEHKKWVEILPATDPKTYKQLNYKYTCSDDFEAPAISTPTVFNVDCDDELWGEQ